ncbi:MAG: hypothetical protein LAN62_17105 [Acidobacteriia bacterium]|nr:hypothetical protein [Terriglobia bacterium]
MPQENSVCISRMILIPALITLGVTILRLVGELLHWPTVLFNPAAGGGGAIVGISWLPIIFGIYFALKLAGAGEGPSSLGKAIGFTLLGLVVMAGGMTLMGLSRFESVPLLLGALILIGASVVIPLKGWPSLTKALIAYGYLARIPVAVIMFFALRGHWGTHYDAPPPGLPEMGFWAKYLGIAIFPQLVGWIGFTVIVGLLFGIVATAIARRGKAPAQATS